MTPTFAPVFEVFTVRVVIVKTGRIQGHVSKPPRKVFYTRMFYKMTLTVTSYTFLTFLGPVIIPT